MLFWQQSLGEEVDVILSPAPVHKHGGGIVEDVYSRPECFYNELVKRTGQRFRLSSYWGPFASIKSSEWITAATAEIMSMKDIAPDLLLTYLPHLDYTLQKYGCEAGESKKAFRELMRMLERLVDEAAANGYEVVIFGDYAIGDVNRVVFPNKSLIQKGLLKLRPVGKRLYPDYYYSRAFAVADHEIAHVYVRDKETTEKAIELFNGLDGIHEVLTAGGLEEKGLSHPNTGDIVLVAAHGAWFAYPWWDKGSEAPDYAAHVDIHNKPGYDPCELFLGWHPFIVSADTNKVKGSHGRTGPGREIALAASFKLDNPPHGLPQLSSTIKHFLEVE